MFSNKSTSNLLTLDLKRLKVQEDKQYQSITSRSNTSRIYLRKLQQSRSSNERIKTEQDITCFTQQQILYKKELAEEKKLKLELMKEEINKLEGDFENKKKELIQSRKQVTTALKGLINSHARFKDYQLGDVKMYKQFYRCNTETPIHLKNTIYDSHKYQDFYGKLQKVNVKLNHQVQFAMMNYRKQLEQNQSRIPNFLKQIQHVL